MIGIEKYLYLEPPETVISGSFRKHIEHIGTAMKNFEHAGVKIIAPNSAEAVDSSQEFIILSGDDPSTPPHKLEISFMRKIAGASFLYVADIDGYIGKSAASEIAYARLKGVPVITAERISAFSEEIPEIAREILTASIRGVLSIDHITTKNISQLKGVIEAYTMPELTPEQAKILNYLIKDLLKELTYIHEKK